MAEVQTGMTATQLQELMAETVRAAIKAAKEPTAAEAEKLDKLKVQQVRWAREQAILAKNAEVSQWNRWVGCAHSTTYNGRKFVRWCGQVNSNGMVHPVCNICHVEAPPFSAKFLPDEGKQGVNFEQWIDASREVLANLHKRSFPQGCERANCFVCHPRQ